MHDAMTYSINFIKAFDAAFVGVGKDVKNGFNALFVVNKTQLLDLFGAVGTLEFQKTVGKSNFSTPPSAMVTSVSVLMSLYFTELLPQLSTSIS